MSNIGLTNMRQEQSKKRITNAGSQTYYTPTFEKSKCSGDVKYQRSVVATGKGSGVMKHTAKVQTHKHNMPSAVAPVNQSNPGYSTMFSNDFAKLGEILKTVLPVTIDGRQAIQEMREGGSPNWRQMEWVGFYLEFLVETKVLPLIGGHRGPKYGKSAIDLMLSAPWDLKSHVKKKMNSVILNDTEAIDCCIREHKTISYFLLEGAATYDDQEDTFKKWHDEFKGKASTYTCDRKNTRKYSRRRKVTFSPDGFRGIELTEASLRQGIAARKIRLFQEGMRNSNGNLRNPKYMLRKPDTNQVFQTMYLDLHDAEGNNPGAEIHKPVQPGVMRPSGMISRF